MKRNKIRLTESQLYRIIKESSKKVLKEIKFHDYDFDGRNPSDWTALETLRDKLKTRNEIGLEDIPDDIDDEEAGGMIDDYMRNIIKHERGSERNHKNAYELYKSQGDNSPENYDAYRRKGIEKGHHIYHHMNGEDYLNERKLDNIIKKTLKEAFGYDAKNPEDWERIAQERSKRADYHSKWMENYTDWDDAEDEYDSHDKEWLRNTRLANNARNTAAQLRKNK